ncbi:arginine--tRNA ligase [Candidatus Gracilibacteria bacterium]|nr:arginine--tRNA ligase [Candidatus Gracilibacteria bacterium]
MNFIEKKISEVFKNIFGYEENFFIYENDLKKNNGQFALKETMKIFGMLKKGNLKCDFEFKNGEEICEKIISEISDNEDFMQNIEKFEIEKPGFLNIFFSEKGLLNFFSEAEKNFFGNKKNNKNTKILVEYGNENIAKEMGVGHLRSNIIGKSLINLFEKLDFQVSSINHLGDYGTQFGKLIYAWKMWGNEEELQKNPIKFLNKIYVKFHDELEKQEDLNEKGKEEFKKLENGDEENLKIWKKFVEFSLQEFQEKYDILGSKFDLMQGESFYQFMIDEIISELDESEISSEGEGGAKIVKFFDEPKGHAKKGEEKAPLMYLKGDGTSTYAIRDLAAIKWRAENLHPNKILYCVGKEQAEHFRQVFWVAEKMGWNKGADLIHVKNGHYRLPEGKMSTRKGNVIKLDELIKTARIKARELLKTKESFGEFDEKYQEKLVESIAIGAIKFNDLSQDREGDIVFTWEKAITFEGMSGPYMQYANTRCFSILRKIGDFEEKNIGDFLEKDFSDDKNEKNKEKNLLFWISKYYGILELSAKNQKVHHLARYIYTLSQEFNSFYAVCRVQDAKNKDFRIFLTQQVNKIISEGLEILGLDVLEKM